MVQDIIIRAATMEDLPELLAFEQGIITAERPFDPTLKQGEINYYNMRDMILASHVHVVVAEFQNKLIASGFARIEAAKPYVDHEKYSYLGFMFVDPAYRSKGINQKIIEALKKWSLEQNITEMRLQVYDENISAIKAYTKAGFSRFMLIMRTRLNDE
jgi:GNAT superfamily N-acetyltransferase